MLQLCPDAPAKRLRLRWIFGVLILVMMGVIFWFSSMNAAQSSEASGRVTEIAIQIVYPDYPTLPAQQRRGAYRLMERIVRKSAHFSEYAVLGCLFALFFCTFSFRYRPAAAWGCATLYAMSDELHQAFVAGRGAMITDVVIDSAGAACGILLAVIGMLLAVRIRRPRG